jgi:carbamoylphosphate synthase small subunit
MQQYNREMLVLSAEVLQHHNKEKQIELLHKVVSEADTIFGVCIAHEVIDIAKGKVHRKPIFVQQAIKDRLHKPFVFLCCKN